jgi:hypothetical protein
VIDGTEGDAEVAVVANVAAADDGDVAGNTESGFDHGFDGADGERVVVAEDCVGARVELEELLHGPVSGGHAF